MSVTLPGQLLKREKAGADHRPMRIRLLFLGLALVVGACSDGTSSTDAPVIPPTILLPASTSPVPTTLFLGEINATPVNQGPTWLAQVAVSVVASDDQPVAGALVIGRWSGGEIEVASCTTDIAGVCVLESSSIRKRVGSVELTITDIEHNTLSHDAIRDGGGRNEDPGTVTIHKP